MGGSWLSAPMTDIARGVDQLFWVVVGITFVVFVCVELLLVVFLLRYRRRRADQQGVVVHGNTKLDIIWAVIPALIVVGLGIGCMKLVFSEQQSAAGMAGISQIKMAGQK